MASALLPSSFSTTSVTFFSAEAMAKMTAESTREVQRGLPFMLQNSGLASLTRPDRSCNKGRLQTDKEPLKEFHLAKDSHRLF